VAARAPRSRGIADISPPTSPAETKEKKKDGEKPMTTDGKAEQEREIPEHCLVRIIDVTIKPGKTYEYRFKVRMVNPNFKRRDVASTNYANDEELSSEFAKTTVRVQVDPELQYYAVDQKALDQKKGSRYDGPNANGRIDEEKQAWIQAHRWVETLRVRGSEQEVGEWTVAERYAVTRGEYVSRPLRVQVPVWRVEREEFVIADDQLTKGKPNMPVEFGYGATGTPQPEAIAVDLDNGKHGIDKVLTRNDEGQVDKTVKVTDDASTEVLIMDPNGRLLLLEGAIDAGDETRASRLRLVKERVTEVVSGAKKSGDSGTGTPFGK